MNLVVTMQREAPPPPGGQAVASLVDLVAARASDAFDRPAIIDGLAARHAG